MVYCKKIYYQKILVVTDSIILTNILLPEVFNHILMHLSTRKVRYDNSTTKYDSFKLPERELKSLQYIIGYVVDKLYFKFKFSKTRLCLLQTVFISVYQLLRCKIDSDDTQKLVNAKDQGGLWRVNETVRNIFIECEKIFYSFTSAFRLIFKYSE